MPFTSNVLSETLGQSGVGAFYHAGAASVSERMAVRRSGQYIRIQLSGTNPLSLAEVQVWESPAGGGQSRLDEAASLRLDDSEVLAECASLSSDICFALAFGARLDEVHMFTLRSDGGGGPGFGVSTMSADPRRYTFYSPEMSLLAETEHTTSATPPVQYEYVWFAGVPVAQLTYSVPSEPLAATEVVWTVTDHLGTPKVQTDATESIVWLAKQEPYGQIFVLRAGEGRHQPLRFPGQEVEQLGTGATNGTSERSYNIFRWFRSSTGSYTQGDPLGLWDGVNLYAYAHGNPVKNSDRTGLACGSGWNEVAPDKVPGVFDFKKPCKKHDKCYGTCGAKKDDCDDEFCVAMIESCDGKPFYTKCIEAAATYCGAVEKYGSGPFEKAQKNCPPCEDADDPKDGDKQ